MKRNFCGNLAAPFILVKDFTARILDYALNIRKRYSFSTSLKNVWIFYNNP